MRFSVVFIFLCVFCANCSAADWNPTLAAKYLDQRQQAWSRWAPADTPDGPCFSCHTGMTYLLARPALRRLLNDKQPTKWETSIKEKMATDAGNEAQGDSLQTIETIFEALFLRDDAQTIGEARARAFEQMWSLQYRDGKSKGAWDWYNANLEPFESPSSFYFEGAMAALAVGSTPREYQSKPEIRERTQALKQYLLNRVAERPCTVGWNCSGPRLRCPTWSRPPGANRLSMKWNRSSVRMARGRWRRSDPGQNIQTELMSNCRAPTRQLSPRMCFYKPVYRRVKHI